MTALRPQQPLRRDGGEPPRTPACCYRTDFHRLGIPEDHVATPLEATGDDLSDPDASQVSAEGSPPADATEAHTAPHVPGEADPEWRHWATGEIQRLRDAFLEVAHEAESLTAERDAWQTVANLAIETADMLKAEVRP